MWISGRLSSAGYGCESINCMISWVVSPSTPDAQLRFDIKFLRSTDSSPEARWIACVSRRVAGFDVIVEFVVRSNTKQISSYRMDHSQSFTQLSIWSMREFDGQRQEHRGMLILLFFRLVTGLLVWLILLDLRVLFCDSRVLHLLTSSALTKS